MSHSALSIANKVLQSAERRGLTLTNMQLIKLIYIAHGWSLALLDKPLVNEEPQAWQHGPVYPAVYREFRDSGWGAVTNEAINPFSGLPYDTELGTQEQAVLDEVVEKYGSIHAFALSNRTHQPGTPWYQTWDNGNGKYRPIPDALVKQHFVGLNGGNA